MKKKCILLFQVLVLLFVLGGFLQEKPTLSFAGSAFGVREELDEPGSGLSLWSEDFSLPAGVYRASLRYDTDQDMENVWSVRGEDASYDGLLANSCLLYAGEHETEMLFYLTETVPVLQLHVAGGENGAVRVQGASIEGTHYGSGIWLISLTVLFGIWDYFLFRKKKTEAEEMERRERIVFLTVIVLVSSLPLFTLYEIGGADTLYHLLRIEGLKEGMLAGDFPVRIQPNWLQGHGYATGIFYCDTFLYLPAFLRMAGFPVGWAYLLYKLLVNAATAWIGYYSFSRIFGSRRIGLMLTALYSLNIYRLICIYLKDHMGQYTAMAFYPLLALGMWQLLRAKERCSKERRSNESGSKESDSIEKRLIESGSLLSGEKERPWLTLLLAGTALVQCHVLSCEIAALFLLGCVLFFPRQFFTKKCLVQVGAALLGTVLLSAWFLIPFLDYMMTQHLIITGDAVYGRTIQAYGSLLPQLFSVFSFAGNGDHPMEGGMTGEIPFTLGPALLIGFGVLLWMKRTNRGRRWEWYVLLMAALSLWMSTVYFPWDALHGLGGFVQKLVSALQYPTRMLGFAALFTALCAGIALRSMKPQGKALFSAGTIAVLVLTCGLFFSTLLTNASFYRIYDSHAMGNGYLSGREYLPEGTDETLLKAGNMVITEKYTELPLLYYKGYHAFAEDGPELQVTDGDNHVVRVLTDGYRGEISVKFISPWYWRVGEVLSLLTILILPLGMIFWERHVKRNGKIGNEIENG